MGLCFHHDGVVFFLLAGVWFWLDGVTKFEGRYFSLLARCLVFPRRGVILLVEGVILFLIGGYLRHHDDQAVYDTTD